ncbi:hypothetical protein BDN72DRAFT_865477 [Pluteus cervinus]|uniref:Uncharacterized protein n=1 Tax=Pluteus cervinus TaxID=181527 RepID=A0ACD3A071_9AGAR|nr:hypothetical protein BDN72DRAFT_865477 [Pluteus cervinus]
MTTTGRGKDEYGRKKRGTADLIRLSNTDHVMLVEAPDLKSAFLVNASTPQRQQQRTAHQHIKPITQRAHNLSQPNPIISGHFGSQTRRSPTPDTTCPQVEDRVGVNRSRTQVERGCKRKNEGRWTNIRGYTALEAEHHPQPCLIVAQNRASMRVEDVLARGLMIWRVPLPCPTSSFKHLHLAKEIMPRLYGTPTIQLLKTAATCCPSLPTSSYDHDHWSHDDDDLGTTITSSRHPLTLSAFVYGLKTLPGDQEGLGGKISNEDQKTVLNSVEETSNQIEEL